MLSGIICVHVDILKEQLTVGTSYDGEFFKYIGDNIVQKDGIIGLHQNDYVDSLEEI